MSYEQTTCPAAGTVQLRVQPVDPAKTATSVAATATAFSVFLVLVIGVPFSLVNKDLSNWML